MRKRAKRKSKRLSKSWYFILPIVLILGILMVTVIPNVSNRTVVSNPTSIPPSLGNNQVIELNSVDCSAGQVKINIKNIGKSTINSEDILITRSSPNCCNRPSGALITSWNWDKPLIEPSKTLILTISDCTSLNVNATCNYEITHKPSGKTIRASGTCQG